jgi:putative membrane protein
MLLASSIVIGLIAFLHFYIMIIEMFMWDKPKGLKAFDLEQDFATSTTYMAANQGLYNGFLAAGLVMSLITAVPYLKLFFLGCVFVAGVFGSLTANKKIIFIQSVPAAVGIALVLLS